ncbi:MAG TPA: hypothetical protein VH107_08130 [Lacipirellulaceae bacterium]|nr:hypothetical protein [Lacipirellulaceae bacterium]
MMPRHFFARLAFVSLSILTWPASLWASDLLDEVPNDALGFAYFHNLSAVDSKVGQLAGVLQRNLPRPLAFLQQLAGVSEGLKRDGDFMLALFPESGDGGAWRFCVWVPVADYDKFLTSVHAKSVEGVAAATIAGEDLLVARHGEWALVMDPDQRERLAELAAATPAPPPMPAWKPWMSSNDLTVVCFAPGLREIQNWLDEDPEASGNTSSDQAGGAFGPATPNGGNATNLGNRRTDDTVQAAKSEFRKWVAAAPELAQGLQQVTAGAVGVRLDESSNLTAGVRVAIGKEFTDELVGKAGKSEEGLPNSPYAGGGFAVIGGGQAAPPLLAVIASAYVRRTTADFVREEKTELDPESLKQLLEVIDKAAEQVRSIAILSQPGEQPQPVDTNNFTVLRVASSAKFAEHANEVMRLWNKANRDAKGGMHMVFDFEETKVGEHAATQYGLDVAAMDGGPVLPEVRQAMEKLFGAGGKLRVWIVPTDDETVLIATATPEQVAEAVKQLERKKPLDWEGSEFAAARVMPSSAADWRLFVDAHRYNDWVRRESLAMIGVPVVGGPLVFDFPASPPVALAGGIREGEIWLEAAALAPTLKSADSYWIRSRARNALQMRGRIIAPARPPALKPN